MEFQDFELRLESAGEGQYRVRVLRSPAGEAHSSFSLAPSFNDTDEIRATLWDSVRRDLYSLKRDVHQRRESRSSVTPQGVGSMLFSLLFSGGVRVCYDESRGWVQGRPNSALRLKIHLDLRETDVARLCVLPWEFLFRDETRDFLCLDRTCSIVRYLDVPRYIAPLSFTPPLRIGLLLASPKNLPHLALDQEKEQILAAWRRHGAVEVVFLEERTREALRRQLLDGFHILHFMGHGAFDHKTGMGQLCLENSLGQADPISGEVLSQLLKGLKSLGLVVLNACQTGVSTPREQLDPFAGVAAALMLAGIPAVVAMQFPISDSAAIRFSTALYSHLAQGESLEIAVTEGRLAIFAAEPQSMEWGTPVLFMRIANGIVFEGKERTADQEADEGMRYLASDRLVAAQERFQRAWSLDPSNWRAATYLCLCLLSGKPIFSLPSSAANEINAILVEALDSKEGDLANLARLLLGILRYDFYRAKGIFPEGISSVIIFRDLERRIPSNLERVALRKVYMSRGAALLFNLDG